MQSHDKIISNNIVPSCVRALHNFIILARLARDGSGVKKRLGTAINIVRVHMVAAQPDMYASKSLRRQSVSLNRHYYVGDVHLHGELCARVSFR